MMRTLYVLASAIVLIMAVTWFVLILPEFREVPMSFHVGDRVGFNLNTTALTFGTVYPGGSSTRNLTIYNQDNYDKTAYLSAEGDMASLVKFQAEVPVPAESNVQVNITATAPAGVAYGNYTGTLKVFLRKAI